MRNVFGLTACAVLAAGAAFAQQSPVTDGSRQQTVKEKAEASSDELSGKLTLFFRDALTGKPIPDAKVAFEDGHGVTAEDGSISFPFPEVPGDGEATLNAKFKKKGYVTSKVPLVFRLGTIFQYHYSISPSLPPGRLRIVLDWGETPPDLDAHLVKEGAYHISYRDMRKAEDEAVLDRDDTDGQGPETITIEKLSHSADYAFFVHDYTHRDQASAGGLSASRGRVMVFGDDGVLKSFSAPEGKAGGYWTVFFIRKGRIVPGSSIGDKPGDAPAAEPEED